MPLYVFQHPKTKETIEVLQSMKDDHVYTDENGVAWDREWVNPNTSIDTQIDPWSTKDFVDKTKNKGGTLGDLFDKSAELSRKRASENGGVDPIKRKSEKTYSKDRKGLKRGSLGGG